MKQNQKRKLDIGSRWSPKCSSESYKKNYLLNKNYCVLLTLRSRWKCFESKLLYDSKEYPVSLKIFEIRTNPEPLEHPHGPLICRLWTVVVLPINLGHENLYKNLQPSCQARALQIWRQVTKNRKKNRKNQERFTHLAGIR